MAKIIKTDTGMLKFVVLVLGFIGTVAGSTMTLTDRLSAINGSLLVLSTKLDNVTKTLDDHEQRIHVIELNEASDAARLALLKSPPAPN